MVQKTKQFRDSGESIRARVTPEVPNGPVGFVHSSLENTKHPSVVKNQRAMDKFRQAVFKIAEISNSAEKDVIEEHLTDYASNFHTPNHPPYAAMIEKAITELNEKSGSSEESISNYIKMEFKDLPWAHSTILKNHLCKLCEFGEISTTCKGCYIIGVPKPKPEVINIKYKPKSKSMRGRGRSKKETDYVEQLHDERVVMTENKNEEKNPTLKTPNMEIGEENEVIQNINEQVNFAMDLNSLPVTSEKLDQIENLQESDTRFTTACKVNLDLLEKAEDGNHRSYEIDSERTYTAEEGLPEEPNLAPELLHAADEKENEDVVLEYEPENRLNHNFLQSESRLTTTCTLYPILDSRDKEEDEKQSSLEAELHPNPKDDKKLEIDCETDFVKVGLTEEQNIAPELLNAAVVKENEDVERIAESESRQNHNLQQSDPNLTTARRLFLNLDSHEKEVEKYQNSEAELNAEPDDSKMMEVDSDRADLVKVGLAEKQDHAPPLPDVAMEEENEDVQGGSESENELNHNLPQSKSILETTYPLCVNLGVHEKEEDKKLLNSEAELNQKPEDGKKQETGGEKKEKDGKNPEKDDEKSDLTLNFEDMDEDDESTFFMKDGEKPEKHGETTEKDGEKTDLTFKSEHIDEEDESNMLDSNTRQQRQMKRWRQSQQKGQPEQIPMKKNDVLDVEIYQQQKQESVISQQPKRQLRSQSQGKVVNHVQLSTPKKSTVPKRAKINPESQTRRLTRSAAAKVAENEISHQIPLQRTKFLTSSAAAKVAENEISHQMPLQRTKLRSWHKQNTESSSEPADRQNSSSRSRLTR